MGYISTMKKRTNIYLTTEPWRKMTRLSRKTLAPVSALIRRAVDEFLAKQK